MRSLLCVIFVAGVSSSCIVGHCPRSASCDNASWALLFLVQGRTASYVVTGESTSGVFSTPLSESGLLSTGTSYAGALNVNTGLSIGYDSRQVYAPDVGGGNMRLLQVNHSTGSLTLDSASQPLSGPGAFVGPPVMDAHRRVLFVPETSVGVLSVWRVNPTNGGFYKTDTKSVPGIVSVAVNPSSPFVFVTTGNSVLVMRLTSSGTLVDVTSATTPANTYGIAMHPSVPIFFVVISGGLVGPKVLSYRYDNESGALTALKSETPVDINGQFPAIDGNFLYIPFQSPSPIIAQYRVDADGNMIRFGDIPTDANPGAIRLDEDDKFAVVSFSSPSAGLHSYSTSPQGLVSVNSVTHGGTVIGSAEFVYQGRY